MAQTKIKLETSKGDLVIELEDAQAPQTAANFIKYVDSGFYDGTVFHRIIPGFVVQGGGFLPGFEKPAVASFDPLHNEADNGLKNLKYSLSMARTNDPHSATSQFFINLTDNAMLDHEAQGSGVWGYAVFGRVVEGQEIVDAMGTVQTKSVPPYNDVPVTDIAIIKATKL